MTSDDLVIVGRLGKARGVDGEMYIIPETDFPDRFLGLERLHVRFRGDWQVWAIASVRLIGGRPVVRFDGVETPEAATRFVNLELAVPKAEVVALPEGSHYIFELIGCRLVDEHSGRLLGTIENVEQYPANDVYVVKTDSGERVLFPAVAEFVKKIDVSHKEVLVDPGGMFEGGVEDHG